MIYLFYGEAFFVEQKIKHWKSEFATKHGAHNIFKFDVEDWDTKSITETIWWGGLFAEKKMVIINWLPPTTTAKFKEATKTAISLFYDYFTANLDSIPADNLIIFTTGTPDGKTKWKKFFLDTTNPNIKLTEFKSDKKEIIKYIQEYAQNQISAENAELISMLCNGNMYAVSNELKKIVSYIEQNTDKQALSSETITEIVASSANVDVWTFLDGIVLENNPKSVEKFITFSQQENNSFQFLGLLYRSVGGLIHLIDAREHNISSSGELAKNSKLPPFTVSRYIGKKDIIIAKKKKFHELYHGLVEIDYKLKTGLLPAESFWSAVLWVLSQ
jgi:DNA polymerase III delta subunit